MYGKALLVKYLGNEKGSQDLVCCVFCCLAVRSFDLTAYINLNNMNIGYLFYNLLLSLYPPDA